MSISCLNDTKYELYSIEEIARYLKITTKGNLEKMEVRREKKEHHKGKMKCGSSSVPSFVDVSGDEEGVLPPD